MTTHRVDKRALVHKLGGAESTQSKYCIKIVLIIWLNTIGVYICYHTDNQFQ